MSGTSGSFVPDIIRGAGHWASGTTVRDIEGHFHKENEPKDATPISGTGGVPNVDFKDKVKNALTGHGSNAASNSSAGVHGSSGSNITGASHSNSTSTGTGLAAAAGTTGPTVPGASSGSTGLGSTTTNSGLKTDHTSNTGVHSTSTGGHEGAQKESLVEKVKHVVLGDDRMTKEQHPHTDATAFTDGHQRSDGATTGATRIGDGVGAHTGAATSTHNAAGTGAAMGAGPGLNVGDNASTTGSAAATSAVAPASPTSRSSPSVGGGLASELRHASTNRNSIGNSPVAPTTTTGTAATATSGATHGVSDTAERDLKTGLSSSTTGNSEARRASVDHRTAVSPTQSNTATPEKKKESFFAKVKEALT